MSFGELIKFGAERGCSTRANLKIDICGEHDGNTESEKGHHGGSRRSAHHPG